MVRVYDYKHVVTKLSQHMFNIEEEDRSNQFRLLKEQIIQKTNKRVQPAPKTDTPMG